uniref:Protein kinase domain-containing protein n=1 Tax=Globisporangium ultimum (strain ATCC 200006 / CBS 805.95 / DAOM BR144) TaxID=431595 RepID=K3WDL7_GLOUD
MHQLSIVHKDLKCANILIGADGDAKITDAKQMGAVQRKPLEYLRGDRVTVASDAYAFGMCILEAASGEPPWDALIDTAVRYHVRKGKLPLKRLENLLDSERALIEMMCASSASDRIKISSVVGKLEEFSKHEATETSMAHGLDP